MKYFLFSLSLLLLFSCSKNHDVEDQLYDCMMERAEKENIFLADEVMDMEQLYVKHNILSNYSGKAKYDVYKEILRTNEYPTLPLGVETNKNLLQVLQWFNDPKCIKSLKGVDKLESKYFQLRKKMDALMSKGSVTPKQGAKAILDVLDEQDLEHPYYRVYFIITMNAILENEQQHLKGISRNPAGNRMSSINRTTQKLVVAVARNGTVWINQKSMTLDDTYFELADAFGVNTENLDREVLIVSKLDRRNDILEELKDDINAAHRSLLDEASLAQYGEPYYAISPTQQETLVRENPLTIKYERP